MPSNNMMQSRGQMTNALCWLRLKPASVFWRKLALICNDTAPDRQSAGVEYMCPAMQYCAGHAWGGLTTAENWVMPNMPRFDTVKVPPADSSGFSLPSLACNQVHAQHTTMGQGSSSCSPCSTPGAASACACGCSLLHASTSSADTLLAATAAAAMQRTGIRILGAPCQPEP